MTLKIEVGEKQVKADAIALGFFSEKQEEKRSVARAKFLGRKNKDIDSLTERLHRSDYFTGAKNSTYFLRFFPFLQQEAVLLVGLGTKEQWSAERARQAGAALNLAQRKEKLPWVCVHSEGLLDQGPKDESTYYLQAFCEGYLLAGHQWLDLKSDKTSFTPQGMSLLGADKSATQTIKKATILAEATHFARTLGDRPGNYLTPTQLGKLAGDMAKKAGLQCQVWDKKQIEKEKMGLFLGVARGSKEEPRFITLRYQGGKKSDRPIALVGKGVTFDSGGISLKPATKMEEMKYDMMGSATVLGICQAAAQLKLPINLLGVVAACENMPGGNAQKPGDVAISRSGKSVEIINTDAEGRLILADALEWAQEQNPQAIIDFATLTGAVSIALGSCYSGIMGTHQELIARIEHSAEVTGERVWELPLNEELEELMQSQVADIKNSSDVRDAGSSKGGIFLKFFVQKKFPWVHCDIAATSYFRKDVNYHPSKFGAGVMIRLTVHLLENWRSL